MKLKIFLMAVLMLIGTELFWKTGNLFSADKEKYVHITNEQGGADGVLEFSLSF